jgi:hypothetical protein
LLQRTRRDADFPHGSIAIDASTVVVICGMIVRQSGFGGIGPVLAVVGEGVVAPSREDDVDTLLEQFAVGLVFLGSLIPSPYSFDTRKRGKVLEPTSLIAAHEGYVQPAAEQVVESGGMLRDAQGIMSGQHVTELVEPQFLGLHADIKRQQPRLLRCLEALDLQMMLR